MNILESVKNLYKGEDKFALHLSIFALTGLAAVSFVNIVSLFLGHSIYSIFSVPSDEEAIIFSVLGIMIFIFFMGYRYKYAKKLLENENSELPSVSMDCFSIFVKMFPLFLLWGIYYFIFYIMFGTILGIAHIKSLFIWSLPILLLPFINCIFIIFTQNFKYELSALNPIELFGIIKKVFSPVIILIIQLTLLFLAIIICFKYLFKFPYLCESRYAQLTIILFITSLSGYIQEITALAYFNSLTGIIKEKILK